jgi:hypothetical protein
LIEVLDGLVDREIGAGVAKRAASRVHVGRCGDIDGPGWRVDRMRM